MIRGHGGCDDGMINGNYNESDIVLNCSNILKQQLEQMGYKVLLTRDESLDKNIDTTINMYDEDGRVNIANASHAKLVISLHMDKGEKNDSGIEVYAPCMCDLSFAKNIADNIVNNLDISYSTAELFKKDDGVYVRNYRSWEITEQKNSAIRNNYEPYDITTSTPYLYMIRECGGVITNAYVDGRNTVYGKNNYINSNIGIETYVIQLGNMVNDYDLECVIQNSELYMRGISDSILEYFS